MIELNANINCKHVSSPYNVVVIRAPREGLRFSGYVQ